MKLSRLIPVYAAAAALILVPALSAVQAQQDTETSKDTAKKSRKKVKKTEQQAGEAAANAASQTPEIPKTGNTRPAATGSAQRVTPSVSDSEIAAAKAGGKVWVNTETGVYHKGGRWYGATKQGKFMTEDDAIKAGYRASKSK